jgi:hypothetical protein
MTFDAHSFSIPPSLDGVFAEWQSRFSGSDQTALVRESLIFALTSYALGRDFGQNRLLDELLFRSSDAAITTSRLSETVDLAELCLTEARHVLALLQHSHSVSLPKTLPGSESPHPPPHGDPSL